MAAVATSSPNPAGPNSVPRGALIGAAGLIAFTILAAVLGRTTGIGAVRIPTGTVVESRELRFADRVDGAVIVLSAEDGREVDVLAPNSNHFVRGTLRGFVRHRKREGITAEPPFRLSRLSDGRLRLEDPATSRRMDLDAFGHSNVGAFSAIMEAAKRGR